MKKFEGVTGDGEPVPNPLDPTAYRDFAWARYACIDEKSGQVTEVAVSGTKHDNGKPDLSLLPSVFVKEVARALMYGEKKYGRYNFEKGFDTHRLLGACLRHVYAWNEGEDTDPESGISHLAHAAASLGMLLRCLELGAATDTRSRGNRPTG